MSSVADAVRVGEVVVGDCLDVLRSMPDDSVDLVFTSPPYEDARTYGMDFAMSGDEWVAWAADRYEQCCRVSKGLVAWVVQGRTKRFRWSLTPAKLMVELDRRGVSLRNPPIYQRVGIPGSGGPDWLRSDYEWVVCSSSGRLAWSDNTACGHEPKFPVGGGMSNRTQDGRRRNEISGYRRNSDGRNGGYQIPARANPGNVIRCHGGGGHMGHHLSHENEAPFPLKLADFFVRSFCPPGGVVLDPFVGSGTTLHAAETCGRRWAAVDVRESQAELVERRLADVRLKPNCPTQTPTESGPES
ncbi:MAG: site-specific DNA-methyltransferase [Planctomycetota bacterium]